MSIPQQKKLVEDFLSAMPRDFQVSKNDCFLVLESFRDALEQYLGKNVKVNILRTTSQLMGRNTCCP